MSSNTSMPAEPRARRRSPSRMIFVLLLLLAAGYFGTVAFQRTQEHWRAAKQDVYLALAGSLAEEIEQAVLAGDTASPVDNPQLAATLAAPLFTQEPALAAVRIWDRALNLACEVARPDTETTRAGEGGILPDLDLPAAVAALQPRLQEQSRVDTAAQLLLLEAEQSELVDRLASTDAASPLDAVQREQFRLLQHTILELAQTCNDAEGSLDMAIEDMRAAGEALARSDATARSAAMQAASDARNDLTMAFTSYRAAITVLPTLPPELAAAAPPPADWWGRVRPALRGQRVLVPLFAPVLGEQLAAPVGYAEVLFYERPGEVYGAVTTLGWREATPVVAPLLLALVLLCWPRRRKRRPAHAAGTRAATGGG